METRIVLTIPPLRPSLRPFLISLWFLLCAPAATAAIEPAIRSTDNPSNVILFMVDGVRWQEFFHGADPLLGPIQVQNQVQRPDFINQTNTFKYVHSNLNEKTFISGDHQVGSENTVSN